jgi:hypothetical protein
MLSGIPPIPKSTQSCPLFSLNCPSFPANHILSYGYGCVDTAVCGSIEPLLGVN